MIYDDFDDYFPDTNRADARGLLACGGNLEASTLIAAYRRGIFPWYAEGQPILWWTPTPRMVLQLANFRFHRSLRKTMQSLHHKQRLEIRINHRFETVIQHCATQARDGQNGTWILPEMQRAYVDLHQQGYAHSIETWIDGQLCGGLYGVAIGAMFFGESMFSLSRDASKIALSGLVALLRRYGGDLIDCQQQTEHLAFMGASPISRSEFERRLNHLRQHASAPWQELHVLDLTEVLQILSQQDQSTGQIETESDVMKQRYRES